MPYRPATWLGKLFQKGETIMRAVVSALLALSVLAGIAGVAAPASAFDAKSFFEQQDRQSGGGS
jgi:hypothetical protein